MRGSNILTRTRSLFLLGFVLVPSLLAADSGRAFRNYPLPIVEVKRILSQWLMDTGFEVSPSAPEADRIRLTAVKENEGWQVILKSNSPLASSIQAEYFRNGRSEPEKVEKLWFFLDGYARGAPSGGEDLSRKIPPSVLSRADSVVCIKARVGRVEVQFSAFIVDKKGGILSTAHDLEGIQEMRVILHNGQEFKGRLVKGDFHRDLAFIQVKSHFANPVELAQGRNYLRDGEEVYAVCYTGERERKILSGIISGPIRRSESLPLWQVDMDTPPGASGSPVFDDHGNLVSMVKGRYRGNHSAGFLIPLWTIMDFLGGK